MKSRMLTQELRIVRNVAEGEARSDVRGCVDDSTEEGERAAPVGKMSGQSSSLATSARTRSPGKERARDLLYGEYRYPLSSLCPVLSLPLFPYSEFC